jgi:hypothetical protein
MAVKNNKNCACKKNDLEQSLVESEEKFRLLMELATDGVLVVQDGKIKEVNSPVFFMPTISKPLQLSMKSR